MRARSMVHFHAERDKVLDEPDQPPRSRSMKRGESIYIQGIQFGPVFEEHGCDRRRGGDVERGPVLEIARVAIQRPAADSIGTLFGPLGA